MLSAEGLTFAYPQQPLLAFPDIQIGSKETLLLLGRSGKGKSTLLHLLAGILPPSSGIVTVKQQPLQQLSSQKKDHFRGTHIGIVFQQHHFSPALTVLENIQLAGYCAGISIKKERISQVADSLGISSLLTRRPYSLSVGEQQRVSIARAVVKYPAVILADEPTSHLDDENANAVAELLHQQAIENNAALLIVTHDERLKNKFSKVICL